MTCEKCKECDAEYYIEWLKANKDVFVCKVCRDKIKEENKRIDYREKR